MGKQKRQPVRRKIGRHEAAARKARKQARLSPTWDAIVGIADTAVDLGRDLDEWEPGLAGRPAQLQEYGRMMREVAQHLVSVPEASDDTLDRLKQMMKDAGNQDDDSEA